MDAKIGKTSIKNFVPQRLKKKTKIEIKSRNKQKEMPGFPMYAAENILDSDENFLGLLLFDIGSASRSPVFNRKYRHNKKGVQKLEGRQIKILEHDIIITIALMFNLLQAKTYCYFFLLFILLEKKNRKK
ncbi:hypothetical protein ES319_D07G190100v1 [Gossypium barbadense]|uniref:Uncharacterized protein n=1 Tax=Gossypium barbadense TaxID=3634 RepID=A0A5J5QUK0_GOSBA|nr:hypothetical protein ES319_D07G190100v1 [Gossypium barbadense]